MQAPPNAYIYRVCGIAGIYYFKREQTPEHLPAVIGALRHRGPDVQASAAFHGARLYHARLSIIDTSPASNQPYQQGSDALVYNGEIFNYRALGREVQPLTTGGDTEVLFKLLLRQGSECLPHLNGFFAFAFYQSDAHRLLVCRDRYGEKPLYYFQNSEFFAFASELKALLLLTGPQELDDEQLYSYLRLNFCSGERTILRGIKRLLPGHQIIVEKERTETRCWYRLPERASEEAELPELLDDAVRIRLNADVPVGAFLSGGLDSSIIAALARRHTETLRTYSIGFSDAPFFDETAHAERVAKKIGSAHTSFKLSENDFISYLDNFLSAIDEPFADASAFNVYVLSMLAGREVKVALSGDGADELFRGYLRHRALFLRQHTVVRLLGSLAQLIPGEGSREGMIKNRLRQLRKIGSMNLLSEKDALVLLSSVSSHLDCQTVLKPKVSPAYFESLFSKTATYSTLPLADAFDMQSVLADDMLVKTDRFGMQHALEIRSPFLDHRIAELALRLPQRRKIDLLRQKVALREAFGSLLPRETVHRSKRGFELPLARWLRGRLNDRVRNEWLNAASLAGDELISAEGVSQLIAQLSSDHPGDAAARVWALIILQQWRRSFAPHIKPTPTNTLSYA